MYRNLVLIAFCAFTSSVAFAESTNGVATGKSELVACANAKSNATRQCDSGKVAKFDSCDCEEGEFEGGDKHQCSVDATCEVQDDKSSNSDSKDELEEEKSD